MTSCTGQGPHESLDIGCFCYPRYFTSDPTNCDRDPSFLEMYAIVLVGLTALLCAAVTVYLVRPRARARQNQEHTKEQDYKLLRELGFAERRCHPMLASMDSSAPKSHSFDLGFYDLHLSLDGSSKKLLSGATGAFNAGRVTAIMGPSGAGKTTLMNALLGTTPGKMTGVLTVNGLVVSPPPLSSTGSLRAGFGFVSQDDIMTPDMTVEEVLRFQAAMRLDRSYTGMECNVVVDNVLRTLDLEGVRHSVVGSVDKRGISGGQRRRVSLGMELVANPSILFLDEPTSGLDSSAAQKVVECLQRMRSFKLTIVLVLHQPSYETFLMIDDVHFLAPGGRTIYAGPTAEAKLFFESLGYYFEPGANPADVILALIAENPDGFGMHAKPASSNNCLLEFKENDDFDVVVPPDIPIGISGDLQSIHKSLLVRLYTHFAPERVEGIDRQIEMFRGREDVMWERIKQKYAGGFKSQQRFRLLPSFFTQTKWFFQRAVVQIHRDVSSILLFALLVGVSAGTVASTFAKQFYIGQLGVGDKCAAIYADPTNMRCRLPQRDMLTTMHLMASLTVGLMAVSASLACFGKSQLVQRREVGMGLSSNAFFVGKVTADMFNVCLRPILFVMVFYPIVSPFMPWYEMLGILLLCDFAVSGIGYLASVVAPSIPQFVSVVCVMGSAQFAGVSPRLEGMSAFSKFVSNFSFCRWTIEALYVAEMRSYIQVTKEPVSSVQLGLQVWGYSYDGTAGCCGCLIALGVGFRVLTCLVLACRRPLP